MHGSLCSQPLLLSARKHPRQEGKAIPIYLYLVRQKYRPTKSTNRPHLAASAWNMNSQRKQITDGSLSSATCTAVVRASACVARLFRDCSCVVEPMRPTLLMEQLADQWWNEGRADANRWLCCRKSYIMYDCYGRAFTQRGPLPQDHHQQQQCGGIRSTRSSSSSRKRSTRGTSSTFHSRGQSTSDALGNGLVETLGGFLEGARGRDLNRHEIRNSLFFFFRGRVRERERQRPGREARSPRQCIQHSAR